MKCLNYLFITIFAYFATVSHLFAAPVVTDITPIAGAPGTPVTIVGSGFTGITTVNFDSVSAVASVSADGTLIETLVPQNVPNMSPRVVQITLSDGSSTFATNINFAIQGQWTGLAAVTSSTNAVFYFTATPGTSFTGGLVPITDSSSAISGPQAIAFHPDGTTAYVVNNGTGKVSAIDIATHAVVSTTTPFGNTLGKIAVNPSGTFAYVTSQGDNKVYVLNISGTNKQNPQVASSFFSSPSHTGQPVAIAISCDGSTLYVLNPDGATPTLTPFNLAANPTTPPQGTDTPITNIPAGGPNFNFMVTTPCAGPAPRLYISDNRSSGPIYSFDTTSRLAPTQLSNLVVSGIEPFGMAVDPTGTRLFAAFANNNQIGVYDIPNNAFLNSLTVTGSPTPSLPILLSQLAFSPDGRILYASDENNQDVFAIPNPTNIPSGPFPYIGNGNLAGATGALAITPDQAPLAGFQTTDPGIAGVSPTKFSTVGLSANPMDCNPLTNFLYAWNFGDGTTLAANASPTATHQYATAGTYTVTLTVTNCSGTSLTQEFPTGQELTKNGGASATRSQQITVPPPAPTASSLSPTSGPIAGGTTVTITGTNFTCVNSVLFGNNAATIQSTASDGKSITVVTPAGDTAGHVDVTVNTCGGSTTVPDGFTYLLPTPTATSLSPNSGPVSGGTRVTIRGTNLTCVSSVLFGGKMAGIISQPSDGLSITVLTPPGNAPGNVRVTVNTCAGSTVVPNGFTYVKTVSDLVCPPRDVQGKQKPKCNGNRVNILTWKAPKKKCGIETPVAYRIYSDLTLNNLLATVPANDSGEFKYKDHVQDRLPKTYFIVSVDTEGNESLAVEVSVEPKKKKGCGRRRHSTSHSSSHGQVF